MSDEDLVTWLRIRTRRKSHKLENVDSYIEDLLRRAQIDVCWELVRAVRQLAPALASARKAEEFERRISGISKALRWLVGKRWPRRVIREVLTLLGQLGPAAVPYARSAVEETLSKIDSHGVRREVAKTLGEWGWAAKDSIPLLLQRLEEGLPQDKQSFTDAFGRVAIPLLEERLPAQSGASMLTREAVIDVLAVVRTWPNHDVLVRVMRKGFIPHIAMLLQAVCRRFGLVTTAVGTVLAVEPRPLAKSVPVVEVFAPSMWDEVRS
jgi:hypothetical protein